MKDSGQPQKIKSRAEEKIRRAAAHPDRPGELCRATPGAFRPIINRAACEGKGDCNAVCPHGVFEITRIKPEHFEALPLLARIKSRVHGRMTAYTPNADACAACGLCVVACPEKAIDLVHWEALTPAA